MRGYQLDTKVGNCLASYPQTHYSPMTVSLASKKATFNRIIYLLLEEGQDLELCRLFFKVNLELKTLE